MTTSHTRQKRPGFFEGVLVALIASVVISISVGVFDWLLPAGLLARVLISAAGLAYLVYLFSRSQEKIGRMTALSVYVLMAVANMVFLPALPWVVIAHLGLIWLIRSLYFYSSVLSALLDLGLTGLSVVGAIAAYLHTDSLFLSLWSLFLVQALFVWIPVNWQRPTSGQPAKPRQDRFDVAYRAAEGAVRKLATTTNP